MKTFRVYAVYETYCYVDVEADTMEEAEKIAEEMDGGDFISEESYDDGGWYICYGQTEEV